MEFKILVALTKEFLTRGILFKYRWFGWIVSTETRFKLLIQRLISKCFFYQTFTAIRAKKRRKSSNSRSKTREISFGSISKAREFLLNPSEAEIWTLDLLLNWGKEGLPESIKVLLSKTIQSDFCKVQKVFAWGSKISQVKLTSKSES